MEARARTSDPDTSHAAAKSVKKMTLVQSRVWFLFGRKRAMTDTELIELWNREHQIFPDSYPRVSESGLRTRRRELVDRGSLKDSGLRQTLPSGRKAILWQRTASTSW
jgi:hypothetical protein